MLAVTISDDSGLWSDLRILVLVAIVGLVLAVAYLLTTTEQRARLWNRLYDLLALNEEVPHETSGWGPDGPGVPYWGDEQRAAAAAEGWDIFESSGSDNGPWQLCKFDDPDEWDAPFPYPFDDDVDVWKTVAFMAAQGSPLHQNALLFLDTYNPIEGESIRRYLDGKPPMTVAQSEAFQRANPPLD